MPTVLRISGFRFFFYSLEGSEPPHVHIEHGDRIANYLGIWISSASCALVRGSRRYLNVTPSRISVSMPLT